MRQRYAALTRWLISMFCIFTAAIILAAIFALLGNLLIATGNVPLMLLGVVLLIAHFSVYLWGAVMLVRDTWDFLKELRASHTP